MPGTRLRVLSMVMDWAKNDPTRMFWLAGLAGTGKTTIAKTLCHMLQADPDIVFGGAFFCSRTVNTAELTDARYILPSLAVDLAAESQEFAAALAKVLIIDSLAAAKPIPGQIGALLQQPLANLASACPTIIFIIDALDECGDENDVKNLLQAISTFACDVNVKFIVTSRPETHISTSPISRSDNNILRLHTIDPREVTEDIRLYISHAFSEQLLEETWYTESDVDLLAARSDGLFIFASTVVAYVLDTESADDRMARLRTASFSMKNSKVATGPLDAVYEFVLTRASNTAKVEPKELEATRQVLACILMAKMPLSILALAEILGWKQETLRASLRRLRSVVLVPDVADQPILRTVHASFGDYLLDRAALDIRISMTLGDQLLLTGCLRIMRKRLHFNISQSRSSHEPNCATKRAVFPLSLEYACLQWAYQLAGLTEPEAADDEISVIFRRHFLFWLEVMSILGEVRRAAAMLIFAAATVSVLKCSHLMTLISVTQTRKPELTRFLRDCNAFVASSREAIERSAPHIYLSALPFAAKDSLIYELFRPLCTGLVDVRTFGIDRHGGGLVMTLTGHTGIVLSTAYFADGRLASGSHDKTVRIWNMRTGDEETPSLKTDDEVAGIAVSQTSKHLAAGTNSGWVYIWNLQAPLRPLQRFQAHSSVVSTVTFSPDGTRIASGSWDTNVCLYVTESALPLDVMSDHVATINTLAFSPDGHILASGSDDNTVRFWNGATGEPLGVPVLEHDAIVLSVCFSPDGTVIAVGLWGSVVQLWDMAAKCLVTTRLSQYPVEIQSIHFPRNGSLYVLTSSGTTAQLWKLHHNGGDVSSATLRGHLGSIRSAVLSPDSQYLATASQDNTIRIWDSGHGQLMVAPFPAHRDTVSSVAVSADGASIVSASLDGSVFVRDARTGAVKLSPPPEQIGAGLSISISRTEQIVRAMYFDHTTRVWDVVTGEAICEIPVGQGTNEIDMILLSPDARWLAIGMHSEFVHMWNVCSQQQSKISPLRHSAGVASFAFSSDGRFLAVVGRSDKIYFWNTDTGEQAHQPVLLNWQDNMSFHIVFSPSGSHIVVGAGLIASVWDIGVGEKVHILTGHADHVGAICYSADGLLIATGSNDRTVRIWDAFSGVQAAILHGHASWVTAVAFTPDGQSLVTGSDDSTIRVWDFVSARSRSVATGSDLIDIV